MANRWDHSTYGLAYVTTSSQKEAEKIAQICLSKKLTACVNIIPQSVSLYYWQNELKKERESLLLIKTRSDLFNSLCAIIKKNHSYTCPCIVFLPISKGHAPFLQWIYSQLKA